METNNLQQVNQAQTDKVNDVVTLSDWMITMLIQIIPIVNIIMLFVWAFGSSTPKSKSNWAKAALIFMAIGIILTILFWGTIIASFMSSSYY